MVVHRPNQSDTKGWLCGPWNTDLDVSIGYANTGIDEPHLHSEISEVYLVARGRSDIRVGTQTVSLKPGDVIVVEPGEPHTFLSSSQDYFHFVLHLPAEQGPVKPGDKMAVSRSVLGLAD